MAVYSQHSHTPFAHGDHLLICNSLTYQALNAGSVNLTGNFFPGFIVLSTETQKLLANLVRIADVNVVIYTALITIYILHLNILTQYRGWFPFNPRQINQH
jgi:hypothetical protein